MHILLTNDDGVHAPGILALAAALSCSHDVTVVAPDRERSAASHALTLDRPLTVKQFVRSEVPDLTLYGVNGTPVDCVRIGLGPLSGTPVDLVVAGINNGANLGADISYSGTVHAALEGAVCGVPSVAFSLRIAPGEQKRDAAGRFSAAARRAAAFVEHMPVELLDAGKYICNVNFPAELVDSEDCVRVCEQGISVYDTVFQTQDDPFGRQFYWVCAVRNETDYNEIHKTDVYWSDRGYITVTPLSWNATAGSVIPALKTKLRETATCLRLE